MKDHLPAGTEVELTRGFCDDEHGCEGLYLPKGWRGVLVDEDGDIGFHPNPVKTSSNYYLGEIDQGWCFYLAPEDYRRIADETV